MILKRWGSIAVTSVSRGGGGVNEGHRNLRSRGEPRRPTSDVLVRVVGTASLIYARGSGKSNVRGISTYLLRRIYVAVQDFGAKSETSRPTARPHACAVGISMRLPITPLSAPGPEITQN